MRAVVAGRGGGARAPAVVNRRTTRPTPRPAPPPAPRLNPSAEAIRRAGTPDSISATLGRPPRTGLQPDDVLAGVHTASGGRSGLTSSTTHDQTGRSTTRGTS